MKTQKSFFEQNGCTYTQVGDVLLPDLSIVEAEQRPIGKYGRMRKRYLKEQHPFWDCEDTSKSRLPIVREKAAIECDSF